tara:strand:+ start:376 stop:1269 length:894 start_codon:yes stop_codon:yes gene_type:complete
MLKDPSFKIRTLNEEDIDLVTSWAKKENFSPGLGDLSIYRNTDNQGIWIGLLNDVPIGCICGIKYNKYYGFIGLFIVLEQYRGRGYGLSLWKHALAHLVDLPCIGLEAAPDRISDYEKWGFRSSSVTTRWVLNNRDIIIANKFNGFDSKLIRTLGGTSIPNKSVQKYDAKKEPSPRPHFLSDWLNHPSGTVLALVDNSNICHGFGRIRPCLTLDGSGWRIGPLLAETKDLAEYLLRTLVTKYSGIVIIDSPGLNPFAKDLLLKLGFSETTRTRRMYKGFQPPISLNDVYGLASLELG